jgi:hypothetical protein
MTLTASACRPVQQSAEWVLDRFFDDDTTNQWDHPTTGWESRHNDYFGRLPGITNPFQFGEAPDLYGRYLVCLRAPGPYLAKGERIQGLVDACRDGRTYDCPCHYAEVVYTTAHRLVCMMCGQMHCALAEPLPGRFRRSWSEKEWDEAFDANGVLYSDNLRVSFVEYQDVFDAAKLWATDA